MEKVRQKRAQVSVLFFFINEKGLSQKLKIKLMAQPFAMQFCTFRQNKRKKPQNEAKKSMTKRGSVKSSFLRVIQFRGESVQEAFRVNRSKPILPFFVRLQSFSIFKANARRKNCVSMFFFPRVRKRLKP